MHNQSATSFRTDFELITHFSAEFDVRAGTAKCQDLSGTMLVTLPWDHKMKTQLLFLLQDATWMSTGPG